jgi:multiple sugar transport system permease protein
LLTRLREFLKIRRKINVQQVSKVTKDLIIGREIDQGLLFKIFLYLILITTAYIYLNPILYMVSTMLKNFNDIMDPTVEWIPTSLYFGQIQLAFNVLKYDQTLWISIMLAVFAATMHAFSCAVAGYAFARLKFPFKKFWLGCLLVSLVMPAQVIILPTIIFMQKIKNSEFITELGLNIDYLILMLPSVFGHGISGALFVIIFRQFFLTQPKELEEAAKIDGANVVRIFTRVVYPLAKPAILVVFLFSFVWTWNDFYYPTMFLSPSDNIMPLATQMSYLGSELNYLIDSKQMLAVEAEQVRMAAAFLVILPPLLLYMIAQRWFVESVERTGIVE